MNIDFSKHVLPKEPKLATELAGKPNLEPKGPSFWSQKRRLILSVAAVVVVLGVGAVAAYIYRANLYKSFLTPQFASAYTLVNDTVSKSANIVINLPKGTDKTGIEQNVVFTPAIKGQWVQNTAVDKLEYKPGAALTVGSYYNVALKTNDGTIGKDFLADEDPKIISVLPNDQSEAPEDSKITIVFNRPMVPLTTLQELESQSAPVEISPQTDGKFKWIGTRTLQFIPKTTLLASSQYTVKVKSGFVSLDGLAVAAQEFKFKTRLLRYGTNNQTELIYDQPIKISFNQPIDLQKTAEKILLEYVSGGYSLKLEKTVAYGTKKVYNQKTKKYDEVEDKSVMLVYNQTDKFGRKKFWDFNDSYRITVSEAVPIDGDINLTEKYQATLKATDVIKKVSATSNRSELVEPDVFDPQGRLWIEFYEDIDINKSDFSAGKKAEIGYGQKCKSANSANGADGAFNKVEINSEVECEKETDYKKVYFEFATGTISLGENFKLNLNKIVNSEGIKLNSQTVEKNVVAYGNLKIYKAGYNSKNSGQGALTEMILCTNNPLKEADSKTVSSFIKANYDYDFTSWYNSYRVNQINLSNAVCDLNQFETQIYLKLLPQKSYQFTLTPKDEFGQTTSFSYTRLTPAMPSAYVNIYQYQKAYSVTTPQQTVLTYASENMDYVNMSICQLSAENMLQTLNQKFNHWSEPATLGPCLKSVNKQFVLPQKYWLKNYFTVDLADYVSSTGHYVLTFTHPNYQSGGKPLFLRSYLTVTNLSVVAKKINLYDWSGNDYGMDLALTKAQSDKVNNLYWVVDMSTLNSVSNAKVELYSEPVNAKTLVKRQTGYTDERGIAKISIIAALKGSVISSGHDSALVIDQENEFEYEDDARNNRRIYAYTDRPIYKPGDTVNFKGLLRVGYDGDYELYSGQKVPIKVMDSSGKIVYNQDLALSGFGSFNGSFSLDKGAPLGTYYVQAFDQYSSGNFEVEEYKPAPFKAEVKNQQDEYMFGQKYQSDVNGQYYFGASLNGGKVAYSLYAQDYHFDKYTDKYFQFGSPWYYCYSDCGYGDKYILSGETVLGENGDVSISGELDFAKLFGSGVEQKSKLFTLHVTVTDSAGQSVSARKTFIAHNGEYYLGLNASRSFVAPNEQFKLSAKSVDTQGRPIAVNDLDLIVSKISWIQSQRQEVDGSYYYSWKKKIDEVSKKSIKTDGKGDWNETMSLPDASQYQITLQGKDKYGNQIKTDYYIYVYGSGYASVAPSNDTDLEIVAEKTNLKSGEKAEVVIKSPYQKAKALLSLERGSVYSYKVVDVNQSLYQDSFTVNENNTPNVYVTAVLVSNKPEVKYGQVMFGVDTDKKELDIEVKSDKTKYLPGENVKLDFTVKDSAGKGVLSELSAAVVDMSVLALKGNPKKSPVDYFYNYFPLTVSTISNLKNVLFKVDLPDGTKGGGGNESADLAKKKRGEFKDTAFWSGVINTDASGKASVSFKLPDNLTTWQVESLGITKDTKVGVDYQEFSSQKPVMITVLKPSFVVPGDKFYVGAQVFNRTSETQSLTVSAQSNDLSLQTDGGFLSGGSNSQSIKLKPNASQIVYFQTTAPTAKSFGSLSFNLTAKNNDYTDSVDSSITITPNDTYEVVATANYSTLAKDNEYIYLPSNIVAGKGGLTINRSASLAVYISQGLDYLFQYPYGCAEQIASKLEAIAIAKKGLQIKNVGDKYAIPAIDFDGQSYTVDEAVSKSLARLYQTQNSDGGFSYYANSSYSYYSESDYYLTLHAAAVLQSLSEAGYSVNNSAIKNAANYINGELANDYNVYSNKDALILGAYTLSQLGNNGSISSALQAKIKALEKDGKFINEQISNSSLAYLAIFLSKQGNNYSSSFKKLAYNNLENRLKIDARGSFISANDNLLWRFYETDIKDTALFLTAMITDKRDNAFNDRVLRWLLNSRAKDGAWGSTNNTLAVIDAMSSYLNWKGENKSDFTLTVSLDGQTVSSTKFDAKSILRQDTDFVSLDKIKKDQIAPLSFERATNNSEKNAYYYDLSLKYYLPIASLPPRDEGFAITREFYALDDTHGTKPLSGAKVGDVVRGHLTIITPLNRNYVSVEDYIPAGLELINFSLSTSDQTLLKSKDNSASNSGYGYGGGYGYYNVFDGKLRPDVVENRYDRLFLFMSSLAAGQYEYDYYARVGVAGEFQQLPAVVSEMYFPENFGRTAGSIFKVEKIK